MVNLERIHETARVACDSVDPWGGGRLTVNLERICKDFGWITCDSVDPGGVNRQSTWEGSVNTLQRLPVKVLILGMGGFNRLSTWEGSAITLQGLPVSVDPGGSIDGQLRKDL